jgi:hypothetical protein
MTAARLARSIAAGWLLAACGGDRPAGGAPSSAPVSEARADLPPPAADRSGAPGARPALRDPVELSGTADVGGHAYRFSGLGECQHTADAAIYEVPASMWSARFTDDAGTFSYLNLTLWQPRGAPALQVSLGLTAGGQTFEIATVRGSEMRGSGTGRVEPKGEGGALVVEGQDAGGHAVKLTVDCRRFTEPVAEGG